MAGPRSPSRTSKLAPLRALLSGKAETTALSGPEERVFRRWVAANAIRDLDHPDSYYDYRGYWKDIAAGGGDQTAQMADGRHFPDTYKQHGHPTFSQESRYSRGARDGGMWVPGSEELLRQPRMAVSHKR